ncbi:hypothetical protein [Streptomyces coffeae]|uniref:DUF5709 domain-containing protein n=1 Tax=Streptomyces coffeae TaxID=621382 RepID=A0ABS1NJC7_9ACTN|nr:hypothetical protein [Streptomyces coffeae]MBL1100141.1 hypothetical protein [Streptomyces coffeae]
MRYQIEAPVRSFSGESVGVTFSKGTGYVDDTDKAGRAALEYFRRHGYGVAPANEQTEEEHVQETGTTQREPGDGDEAFDPGEHSVDDVLAYLDTADEDETARVLDAEKNGKARKTILARGEQEQGDTK